MTCTTCGAEAVVQWRRLTPDETATEPVYGCADHALTPEAAGYTHRADCPGPGTNGTCPCPAPAEPEFPFTDEDQAAAEDPRRMPPGW